MESGEWRVAYRGDSPSGTPQGMYRTDISPWYAGVKSEEWRVESCVPRERKTRKKTDGQKGKTRGAENIIMVCPQGGRRAVRTGSDLKDGGQSNDAESESEARRRVPV